MMLTTVLQLIGTIVGMIGILLIPIIAIVWMCNRETNLADMAYKQLCVILDDTSWTVYKAPIPSNNLSYKSFRTLSRCGKINLFPAASTKLGERTISIGICRSPKYFHRPDMHETILIVLHDTVAYPSVLITQSRLRAFNLRLTQAGLNYIDRYIATTGWVLRTKDESPQTEKFCITAFDILARFNAIRGIESNGNFVVVIGPSIDDKRKLSNIDTSIHQALSALSMLSNTMNKQEVLTILETGKGAGVGRRKEKEAEKVSGTLNKASNHDER